MLPTKTEVEGCFVDMMRLRLPYYKVVVACTLPSKLHNELTFAWKMQSLDKKKFDCNLSDYGRACSPILATCRKTLPIPAQLMFIKGDWTRKYFDNALARGRGGCRLMQNSRNALRSIR